MKPIKLKLAMRLLAIGLLMVCVSSFINKRVALPDWAMGSIMGAGIGLELVAVAFIVKIKKNRTA